MLSCYGYEPLTRYEAYCRHHRGATHIHASVNRLPPLSEEPYTHGVQVAIIRRDGGLLPTLGLLSLAHREGLAPRRHYAVVSWRAATLFLYGRDVLQTSLLELQESRSCRGLPLVVLTPAGEPLGYGRPTRRNGELLIRNILDAGWYLRSGV
jgi:60S ribosome subunit biogenesis protein NIP7